VLVRLPVTGRGWQAARPCRCQPSPGAARRLPERAARLLHPPCRCAVRAGRRAAVRPRDPVAAAPEPGAGPPARLGQQLRRPGPRPHRHRAAASSAGALPPRRRPAGVRGGCDHLAALRRRVLARARLLLPSLPPLSRPADYRRLGVPVDRAAGLRARLLDRPGRRPPAAPAGGHRPARRLPGPRAARAAPRRRTSAAGGLRRRLRLGPAHARPGRAAGGGAGAVAIRPLLLRRSATPTAGARRAGRVATGPSSTVPTRPPGRPRPPP
jgi:hypothetical protein